MKVPIKYKSSDRYNAGTDIVYDDGSKLQYAPFIYAGVTAKDNGDGGGDDEEGEDTMVVILDDETSTIDKSYKDIKDAYDAGKIVLLKYTQDLGDEGYIAAVYYLVTFNTLGESPNIYRASFATAVKYEGDNIIDMLEFKSSTETDNMTQDGAA